MSIVGFEPLSLDQLTMFLAVVDHQGFSAAARALGRVQSAVSQSVAGLEQTLGNRLFDRSSRPPRLTPAGRRLAAEARLVLAQARALRQVASAMQEGLEPGLTLAVDPLFPMAELAAGLEAFHAAFPTVSLRVHHDLLGEALARVRSGEAELGICNLAEAHPRDLTIWPAAEVRMIPVCAPTHALAAAPPPHRTAHLEQHTQIVLSERRDQQDDHAVLSPRTFRVTDLELKLRLIQSGVGWGNMPHHRVEALIASGALAQLRPEAWLDGEQRVRLHATVRTDRPLGPAGSWLRARLAPSERPCGDGPVAAPGKA